MLGRVFREIWRSRIGNPDVQTSSAVTSSSSVRALKSDFANFPIIPIFESPIEAQEWLKSVVVPYLNECSASGRILEAEHLEQKAYAQAIKVFEDRGHYEASLRILHSALHSIGMRANAAVRSSSVGRDWRPAKLVFFVHNLSADLAHNELLCNVIRAYLTGGGATSLRLLGGGRKPAKCYEQLARDFGISVECLGMKSLYSMLDLVALQLEGNQSERCIIVAVPLGISYLCGQVPSQRLGWLSMKFEVDAFPSDFPCYAFTSSRRSCHYRGKVLWRTAPPLMVGTDLQLTSDKLSLSMLESLDGFEVVLFTINREEKIRNPQFLDAVSSILNANREACFVWTGRARVPEIDNYFRARGVLERTFFAGWVVPDALLRRGDIFLDTPRLSGMTAAKGVANGIPVLTFTGAHSWVNFFAEELNCPDVLKRNPLLAQAWMAMRDNGLKLECESVEVYVAQALRLIADHSVRSVYSDFLKKFASCFFNGDFDYANMHMNNFMDSID
ncbi:hypothetical protein [Hydrogenophaga defluvii]|uniref:Glycosyl transferase family 1 n=1 Tax=Hydrogenophaga defluvii TaxID=249410 RepID=A0ABW2SEK2_9BURK